MRRLILPLCLTALLACGSPAQKTIPQGEKSAQPTPEPAQSGFTCVEPHAPPSGYHVMKRDGGDDLTIERCDPGEKVQIHNGDVEGKPITYGAFTGYLTGIGDITPPVLSFYLLLHGRDIGGQQQNVHAGLWGTQPMNNRLVRHWWATDNSWPDITQQENTYRFDPAKTYRFTGSWNAATATVTICEGGSAAEVTANPSTCKSLSQSWKGGMKSFEMQGFLFGNKILKGFSFGSAVRIVGLRFTLYEEGADPNAPPPSDGGTTDGDGGTTDGGNIGGGRVSFLSAPGAAPRGAPTVR